MKTIEITITIDYVLLSLIDGYLPVPIFLCWQVLEMLICVWYGLAHARIRVIMPPREEVVHMDEQRAESDWESLMTERLKRERHG